MRLAVMAVFLFACSVAQQDLDLKLLSEFAATKERVVDKLAKSAAKAFQERYRQVEKCACSRHSCSNENGPGAECSDALGSLPECECKKSSKLDYNSTAVLLAPGSHPKKLSAQVRESLCTYSGLTPVFKDLNVTTWTYVASVDGTFRSYPVRHRRKDGGEKHLEGCSTFDPRVRPWYIAASTGPKDVVVVVDTSGSMEERWSLTKKALLSLLDTFTFVDYVNIVTFSDDAEALTTGTPLLAATPENLKTMKDGLQRVKLLGGTDFNQGFRKAFDLLKDASKETAERTSSGCTKVIIFLTDGEDCSLPTYPGSSCSVSNKDGPEKVLSNIEDRQVDLEAKSGSRALIFTFSMGRDADDSVPKQIACANDGAWSFFEDDEDPLLKLNSYYTFLAAARYPGRSTWITPFDDAFGLGRLTSVAKPVYSPKGRNGTTGALIAVVGHDVKLKELELANIPSDVIVEELASLSRGCDELKLGGCQLQAQRDHSVDDATCPDRLPKKKCYEFRRRWYKRFDARSSWSAAKATCKKKGGNLVSIRSDQHLSFIASLSSPGGTWTGGRTSSERKFLWEDESVVSVQGSSDYWAHPGDLPEDSCASIDPRGVKRNMDFVECYLDLSFICEFESKPRSCKGNVAVVDPDSFFEVPPLSLCRDEEDFLGRLRPIPQAESMESSQALCPLGHGRPFEDLVCCSCRTSWKTILIAVAFVFTVLSCIFGPALYAIIRDILC
ncbi:hypothetical protein BSKO_07085 [Bryopsis sp. KO-2023]|nr:hypothetical protein BSKO_07085 [Bryopsis sp. KO-2023]